MPILVHNIVEFNDGPGWSVYTQEHAYEHVQFVQMSQAASPVFLIPDYDFFSWDSDPEFVASWINSHAAVHNILRGHAGGTGFDLSNVDFTKEDEFYRWLDVNNADHIAFRQFYGIV